MIGRSAAASGRRLTGWDRLPGWSTAPMLPAFAALQESAALVATASPVPRVARLPPPEFTAFCRGVLSGPPCRSHDEARRFFEARFDAFAFDADAAADGFVTGYYEPVVDGSRIRSDAFAAPVLDLPPGTAPGSLDRAGWEAFALTPAAAPVVWLRDWTEVFLVQVQGSARVRLPDGSFCRLVYAGRNGAPYTSIGRRLIETGRIAAADMSLATLKRWLRSHGQDEGEEARSLMQENASYIFFRLEADPDSDRGPVGGQGVPLVAGVSIAVDRSLWCYGLPFWIETREAVPGFGQDPLRRLFIAQDTGSAIVGPARADLFLGSGEAAGEAAGLIRHAASVTVLLPRSHE